MQFYLLLRLLSFWGWLPVLQREIHLYLGFWHYYTPGRGSVVTAGGVCGWKERFWIQKLDSPHLQHCSLTLVCPSFPLWCCHLRTIAFSPLSVYPDKHETDSWYNFTIPSMRQQNKLPLGFTFNHFVFLSPPKTNFCLLSDKEWEK